MIITGCDYHPGFQQIAFVDTETGELQERRLQHREEAEKFYRDLAAQGAKVRVGMEASGHARWFERLLAGLQFELRVGDAAEIRTKRVRKQKTDRQDAQLILRLLIEDRFPQIWVPSWENRDLRQLLWHRHRMVQARTRIMNQLQAVALNEGLRCKKKKKLWREAGRKQLESFGLAPWADRRRQDLLELLDRLSPRIAELTKAIEQEVEKCPAAKRLMTHPGVGPLTALAFVLIIGPSSIPLPSIPSSPPAAGAHGWTSGNRPSAWTPETFFPKNRQKTPDPPPDSNVPLVLRTDAKKTPRATRPEQAHGRQRRETGPCADFFTPHPRR
jgi:transposase